MLFPLFSGAVMHARIGRTRHRLWQFLSARLPVQMEVRQGGVDTTVVGSAFRQGLQVYFRLLLRVKPTLIALVTGGSAGQGVTAGVTGVLGLPLGGGWKKRGSEFPILLYIVQQHKYNWQPSLTLECRWGELLPASSCLFGRLVTLDATRVCDGMCQRGSEKTNAIVMHTYQPSETANNQRLSVN